MNLIITDENYNSLDLTLGQIKGLIDVLRDLSTAETLSLRGLHSLYVALDKESDIAIAALRTAEAGGAK